MAREVSQRGGNKSGGRKGHLAIGQRRTVLALKSIQMLTLERLETGASIAELTEAEAALKEALRLMAEANGERE